MPTLDAAPPACHPRTDAAHVPRDGGVGPAAAEIGIALAALGAYLALEQVTLFLSDGHYLIRDLRAGSMQADRHRLARPLFAAAGRLLGLDARSAVTVVNAVASAIAVWLTGRIGSRLGLSRAAALRATLLVAVTPAVVFFATTVELHGLFLAFAAATLWVGAASHGLRGAVAFGLCGGVATLVHNSGLVLVAGGALWIAACRGPERSRLPGVAGRALLAVAVQFVTWRLGVRVAATLGWSTPAAATPYVAEGVVARLFMGFTELPGSLLREWLIPFLPLALLAWRGPWDPRRRLELGACAVLILGYSLMCGAIGLANSERGAYVLPVALPLAIAAARRTPRAVVLAAAGLSAVLAVAAVRLADVDRGRVAPYVEGVRAVAAGEPVRVSVLLNPRIDGLDALDEMGACILAEPPLDHVDLSGVARLAPVEIERHAANIATILAPPGRRALVSRATLDLLETRADRYPAGPALGRLLRTRFTLRPVAASGFDGYVLDPLGATTESADSSK